MAHTFQLCDSLRVQQNVQHVNSRHIFPKVLGYCGAQQSLYLPQANRIQFVLVFVQIFQPDIPDFYGNRTVNI